MRRVPLQSVADITRGVRIDYDHLADTGTRFLNAKALADNDAPAQYLPEPEARWAYDLEPGDVVLAVSFRPGAARVVDEELRGAVVGSDCVVLRALAGGPVTPGWLGVWARSSYFQGQVEVRSSGSGIPRIAARDVAQLQVPVPSLDHQDQTNDAVSELDRVHRELRQLADEVNELRALEIDLAVVDDPDPGSSRSIQRPTSTTAAGRRKPR
ncbi:MAG: hypothetical protein KY469_09780 [Actinobacteria bacterium]|nr:hypothetical protein [Actinomycetota bacterium]